MAVVGVLGIVALVLMGTIDGVIMWLFRNTFEMMP